MFDTPEKRRVISKWDIGTVACCVLIYLSLRHISSIAQAFSWLVGLARPLMIGGILALILLCIPYAPMVGALIGVTALIPVVGMILGVPAASAAYTLIGKATDQRERKRSMSISAEPYD